MQINSVDLRIGNSKEQKFISNSKPTISWKINSIDQNLLMEAYKIEIASDLGFKENNFETGEVARNNPINISWPREPLSSREVAFLRVSTKSLMSNGFIIATFPFSFSIISKLYQPEQSNENSILLQP